MSFDFFNPSHLAFGAKLTKAFNSLERICLDAEDALGDLIRIQEVYNTYVNRNYPCPAPSRPDAPCRTNEIFDLINDVQLIKTAKINENGEFECAINLFKRATNRLTIASGTTKLKEGSIYVNSSISNQRPERELQFVENDSDGTGQFLAKFRIDEDNNINIVGDSSSFFIPGDFNHIVGMKSDLDSITLDENNEYTANDYECVLVTGNRDGWQVILNGSEIGYTYGLSQYQTIPIYLKPGDVLKTTRYSKLTRVRYLAREVTIPGPVVLRASLYNGTIIHVDGTDPNYPYFDNVQDFLNASPHSSIRMTGTSVGERIGIAIEGPWHIYDSVEWSVFNNSHIHGSNLPRIDAYDGDKLLGTISEEFTETTDYVIVKAWKSHSSSYWSNVNKMVFTGASGYLYELPIDFHIHIR